MKKSIKIGFSFGLTSGVITTLGLIIGLYASTHSKLAILGGILTIAVADAFSDSLGMHISQESEAEHTTFDIWQSTISTFLSKFIFALTFALPFFIFDLYISTILCVIWGFLLLGVFSYFIAREQKIEPWKAIAEHLIIGVIVIILSNYVGSWIEKTLK